MRTAVTTILAALVVLGAASCAAPEAPRLYGDDGDPIVGKLKTRYGTVELTADELDARTESGLDLREMRAQDIMADVVPEPADGP